MGKVSYHMPRLGDGSGRTDIKDEPRSCFSVTSMGYSFQDYSWIQDFEADFP